MKSKKHTQLHEFPILWSCVRGSSPQLLCSFQSGLWHSKNKPSYFSSILGPITSSQEQDLPREILPLSSKVSLTCFEWHSQRLKWDESQCNILSEGSQGAKFMHLPEALRDNSSPRECRQRAVLSTAPPLTHTIGSCRCHWGSPTPIWEKSV